MDECHLTECHPTFESIWAAICVKISIILLMKGRRFQIFFESRYMSGLYTKFKNEFEKGFEEIVKKSLSVPAYVQAPELVPPLPLSEQVSIPLPPGMLYFEIRDLAEQWEKESNSAAIEFNKLVKKMEIDRIIKKIIEIKMTEINKIIEEDATKQFAEEEEKKRIKEAAEEELAKEAAIAEAIAKAAAEATEAAAKEAKAAESAKKGKKRAQRKEQKERAKIQKEQAKTQKEQMSKKIKCA